MGTIDMTGIQPTNGCQQKCAPHNLSRKCHLIPSAISNSCATLNSQLCDERERGRPTGPCNIDLISDQDVFMVDGILDCKWLHCASMFSVSHVQSSVWNNQQAWLLKAWKGPRVVPTRTLVPYYLARPVTECILSL